MPINIQVGSQESIDLLSNIVDGHGESFYSQIKIFLDYKRYETNAKVKILRMVEMGFPVYLILYTFRMDSKILGLVLPGVTSFYIIFELFQVFIQENKWNFFSVANILDMLSLLLILIYSIVRVESIDTKDIHHFELDSLLFYGTFFSFIKGLEVMISLMNQKMKTLYYMII